VKRITIPASRSLLVGRVDTEQGVEATEAGDGVESGTERADSGERTEGAFAGTEGLDGDDTQDDCEDRTQEAIFATDVVRRHTTALGVQ
jgi:hypothetical protein